jgi:hypothetical protein
MHACPQVGTSKRLYSSIVSLCRTQYAKEGTVAACSVRSQLLMALHDASAEGGLALAAVYSELCEPDRCHKLAWVLDACVKVRLPLRMATAAASADRLAHRATRTATATRNG